ncbi:sulfite oxidase [Halalkalibacter alkalisediminis]|uniref:Sulfite oxidase n=1 Tax=Halalkalibacter alkalisediminis TaxID=935616 RepID=A0ABV6NPY9_9BACI|nr:sulfite oxidase [Halalkalibacter alkalisediminis]
MTDSQNPLSKPHLTTRRVHPENQETPIHFIETDEISHHLFFKRNHFSYPTLPHSDYRLAIQGFVETPRLLSLQDLARLPPQTAKVVLECAGDKRSLFEPKVFGEQWDKGAISQGHWKGVSLRTILEFAGIRKGAKEVVVEGYDYGERPDSEHFYSYMRSLPIEKALHPDTLIAYEYNNQPLPFKHGYPLRLIVPQWYAMASVKWIKQITVIDSTFIGPYQSNDYVYFPHKEHNEGAKPVTNINVNSTIQTPLNLDILSTGTHVIKGIAWTGKGHITNIEISTDHGQTWSKAIFKKQEKPDYGWVSWSFIWTILEEGEFTIMSKATDSYYQVQPVTPFWNRKGYGYNAVDQIKVKIE